TQKLSSLAPMVVGLTFRESRTVPGYFKSFEAIIIVSKLFMLSASAILSQSFLSKPHYTMAFDYFLYP
ncbi:hypothetical protein, partial [Staphylococcus intermedius]|uniref:hypothetical protein n=1 Tax=Staphylococcus intermedius TaxID=1285 RepID=UPI001CA55DC4